MPIPGSNLLNMAFRAIAKQPFQYVKFISRSTKPTGALVSLYAKPVSTAGSVQPVPRRLYEQYGLDFQKKYYQVFASYNIIDINRDVSGDQIIFQGMKLQCESDTPWFGIDGWKSILCVQVKS